MFKKFLVAVMFGLAGTANALTCDYQESIVMGHNNEQVTYQTALYRDLNIAEVEFMKAFNTQTLSAMYANRHAGGSYVFNFQWTVNCSDGTRTVGPDIFWVGYTNIGQGKVWSAYFNSARQKVAYAAN